MVQHKIQIINQLGMHARAAAKLVKTASQFTSHIEIKYNDKIANAKDMLAVMMLGLSQYSWIELLISGNNTTENKEALSQLQTLINNFFGENS